VAEFPALPLFTDALLADTGHLTEEEFGAYMRLLILEWRTAGCKLPADAAWHMRRLGCDESKYKRLFEPLLGEFFGRDGNFIYQKRLLKEFTYLRNQSQNQSARAKARWNKKKTSCRSDAASGNAPHPTPPLDKNKNSPLPSQRSGKARDGSLKNGKGEIEGGERDFDILRHLDDVELAVAKAAAECWDITHLAAIYNESIRTGRLQIPRRPLKAFAAWCKSYTKGRPP
jgi:uncharacterized protein YdaU (DUF1376 family)